VERKGVSWNAEIDPSIVAAWPKASRGPIPPSRRCAIGVDGRAKTGLEKIKSAWSRAGRRVRSSALVGSQQRASVAPEGAAKI